MFSSSSSSSPPSTLPRSYNVAIFYPFAIGIISWILNIKSIKSIEATTFEYLAYDSIGICLLFYMFLLISFEKYHGDLIKAKYVYITTALNCASLSTPYPPLLFLNRLSSNEGYYKAFNGIYFSIFASWLLFAVYNCINIIYIIGEEKEEKELNKLTVNELETEIDKLRNYNTNHRFFNKNSRLYKAEKILRTKLLGNKNKNKRKLTEMV